MGHITDETFAFLFELDVHNSRTWMDANRDRYEEHCKQALYGFVEAVAAPLHARVSTHLQAIPRIQGGSVFQIHRDTRFSDDKTPYKRNAGCYFSHDLGGKGVSAPGLYLHLEPGNCFTGGGVYRPPTTDLNKVRDKIVGHRSSWSRVRNQVEADGWTLGGDQLKTSPRGYDADDTMIEDLRRTSFVLSRPFDEATATRDDFVDVFVGWAEEQAPFLRYLCRALDLPF